MSQNDFIGSAPNASGIYLILHDVSGSVYIGQSNRIRVRLMQHYNQLNNKIHSNHKLQVLWDTCPYKSFRADVYILCPEGLSALETQRWLVKHERKAINEYKSSRNVVNMIHSPDIVATHAAIKENSEKRKAKSTAITNKRREIKAKITETYEKLKPYYETIKPLCKEIEQRELTLKKSKTFFCRIFGGPSKLSISQQQSAIVALNRRISQIKEQYTSIFNLLEQLNIEYEQMYYDFPKVIDQTLKKHLRGLYRRGIPRISEFD